MVGPTPAGDRLAVVRLGGHREPEESPWECAAREVREEASIQVTPVRPPATYWLSLPGDIAEMEPREWNCGASDEEAPLLVVEDPSRGPDRLSVMFLARADSLPIPSGESKGLVLLRLVDVHSVATGTMTFGEYRASGGRAIVRDPLPDTLVLEPFLQLRALALLLSMQPGLDPSPGTANYDRRHGP